MCSKEMDDRSKEFAGTEELGDLVIWLEQAMGWVFEILDVFCSSVVNTVRRYTVRLNSRSLHCR
jgi:hypothetical protein